MDINKEDIKNLEVLLGAMRKDHLGRKDFEEMAKRILQLVAMVKDKFNQSLSDFNRKHDETTLGLKNDNLSKLEEIKSIANSIIRGKDGYTPVKGKDYYDGLPGKNGLPGKAGRDGKPGRDGSPDTPEMIIAKLRRLPKGKGLKVDDIEDLKKLLNDLKGLASRVIPMGGSAGGGGRIVKSYDISASLDGVTKTFTLPSFWRVISVHTSSFPNALRETTDYTTDASAMTLTFTAAITAGTTLASGQTVVIVYSE